MTSNSAAGVYADFKNAAYFPSLNGVRAICALMVLKEHAKLFFSMEPRLTEWGYLGVDMFFVISGFLIVTLLLRERDRNGTISLRQFYARRTLRIFPIYYLSIAILFFIAIATYRHSTKTWDLYKYSFPVFLLYLQDFLPVSLGVLFHTWSLAMEEQFYLVWPTIERFFNRQLIVPILLVFLLVSQLCNFGVLSGAIVSLYGDPAQLQRPVFLITFTPILLGVLAAHAMHDPKIGAPVSRVLGNRWAPLVLMVAAGGVCQFCTQLQGAARLSVHVLFCAALVSMVLNPRGAFSRFLQWKPLAYLGTISYGIYLYHTFVLWIIERYELSHNVQYAPGMIFAIVTPVAILIAAISFRYFETPIMASRHKKGQSVGRQVTA